MTFHCLELIIVPPITKTLQNTSLASCVIMIDVKHVFIVSLNQQIKISIVSIKDQNQIRELKSENTNSKSEICHKREMLRLFEL